MYKNLLRLGLSAFAIAGSLAAFAQANDECATAIALPVEATCVPTSGTITTATSSGITSMCDGVVGGDVWYSFVATEANLRVGMSNTTTSVDTALYAIVGLAVYDGSCGALTELDCNTAFFEATATGTMQDIHLSNLTVGNTYYIRVWKDAAYDQNFNTIDAGDITFDVCVKLPPTPPANDECTGAYEVTVGTPYVANNEGATQSLAPIMCEDFTADAANDVWYSFTPTNTTTLSLSVSEDNLDMISEVFSGDCNNLVNIACIDMQQSVTFDVTAGQTYYMRSYDYTGTNEGQFTITLNEFVPAGNDECTGAYAVTPGTPLAGNSIGATESMPAIECETYTADIAIDVWYSYTATATGQATLNVSQDQLDLVAEVFNGACDNLVNVACFDMEDSTTFPVTAGETYYFRIYSYGGESGNFTINISEAATVITVDSIDVTTVGGTVAVIDNPNGGTLQMTATVYPAAANQGVTWSIVPGTGAATISASGLVTAQAAGTVWAKAVSTEDATKSDSAQITINAETTGLNNLDKHTNINVYPNPTTSNLYINLGKAINNLQATITDAFGKELMQVKLKGNTTQQTIQVSSLASGVYFIHFTGENINQMKKFVKQ